MLKYICRVRKLIAIISLFLVTIGSFYPCCLDDDCASETTAVQSQEHSSDEEGKDQGFCSPFSVCASCAVSVEMQQVHISMQELSPSLPLYNAYRVSDREGIYTALFQPPRCC